MIPTLGFAFNLTSDTSPHHGPGSFTSCICHTVHAIFQHSPCFRRHHNPPPIQFRLDGQ